MDRPGCPPRQTVVTAWGVGAAHLATRGCEFFFCSNVIGRRINTCSTLISVDFGAACSLSHYFLEKSAKYRRCQLERLWQADRVSQPKRLAGSPKHSPNGPVSTQKPFLAQIAPMFRGARAICNSAAGHNAAQRTSQLSSSQKGGARRWEPTP